jgi:hypothetical protein
MLVYVAATVVASSGFGNCAASAQAARRLQAILWLRSGIASRVTAAIFDVSGGR